MTNRECEGMPPLPEPYVSGNPHSYFTDEQVIAYGRLVAQECAGICRDMACGGPAFNSAATAIEAAIRKQFNLEAPT